MTTNEDAGTNSDGLPLQSARTRRFSLGVPRQFTVSPDGERVLFIRTTGGTDPVSRLWLYEDGAERMLADPAAVRREDGDGDGGEVPQEELARRERAREMSSGVVSYATDADVRIAAFALQGELWVVRTDGTAPRRIATAGPVVDPRPSPDGALDRVHLRGRAAARTERRGGRPPGGHPGGAGACHVRALRPRVGRVARTTARLLVVAVR